MLNCLRIQSILNRESMTCSIQSSILTITRVREKFKDLRWVPLEPEFIEYPNSQFLMIGEAQDTLGKAATSEGRKQQHEQEPDQELEKLEEENEHRVEALEGKIELLVWIVDIKLTNPQATRPSSRIWAFRQRIIPSCRQPGPAN